MLLIAPDCFRSHTRLPLIAPDCFRSHTWSNQDVCATIKRQLQLLLPDSRIFLDVDDLESIDKLESYVARCDS